MKDPDRATGQLARVADRWRFGVGDAPHDLWMH
jgi:hypothetical protein